MDVQTPETPGRFSLRLNVYSPPQVLQINGRLCHLVLAFPMLETLQMAGPLRSADIAPLHRYYGPSRHPLVFGRLPGFAGYTAYLAPNDFAPGRGGLLQLLSMSLSPCCRFHPAKVSSRVGQISAVHVAFALRLRARPLEVLTFEATTRLLLLRPGDS